MNGYVSLTDPPASSALGAATGWIQTALLGSVASIVAVIAVAAIGLMLMSGRVDVRRAALVVVGCFVLFGAPIIAAGLAGLRGGARDGSSTSMAVLTPPPPPQAPRQPPNVYDPYAGASVPTTP